jgi:hypothetical protein
VTTTRTRRCQGCRAQFRSTGETTCSGLCAGAVGERWVHEGLEMFARNDREARARLAAQKGMPRMPVSQPVPPPPADRGTAAAVQLTDSASPPAMLSKAMFAAELLRSMLTPDEIAQTIVNLAGDI